MATTMLRSVVLAFSLASISAQATPILQSTVNMVAPERSTQALFPSPSVAGVVTNSVLGRVLLGSPWLVTPTQTFTAAVMPPLPEPPMVALLALAFGALSFVRRRRRK